jgi:DNA-binding response OmpR family regulator
VAVRRLVASALRHDGYRLLLAGSAEEALAVPAMKDSIALLQKPFTMHELRRRIRAVLDR